MTSRGNRTSSRANDLGFINEFRERSNPFASGCRCPTQCMGPEGPQGPQGTQGIQGPQGTQGIQGVPGTNGQGGILGEAYFYGVGATTIAVPTSTVTGNVVFPTLGYNSVGSGITQPAGYQFILIPGTSRVPLQWTLAGLSEELKMAQAA